MTSKPPPIPPEQRAFHGERADIAGAQQDRRDARTGLQSGQPGDADANLSQQGRFGNIKQHLTPQKSVQDR